MSSQNSQPLVPLLSPIPQKHHPNSVDTFEHLPSVERGSWDQDREELQPISHSSSSSDINQGSSSSYWRFPGAAQYFSQGSSSGYRDLEEKERGLGVGTRGFELVDMMEMGKGKGVEGEDRDNREHLEVEELDQAGNVVATYIASSEVGKVRRRMAERIDIVVPKRTKTWVKEVVYAFLPAGYPHSVTPDYMEYQIYDSMQAFSSSIASLLASRAVLEGVGVGDADATATGALLLSILQSSMGRIATILFAHRLGTSLEPECKMYRLSADIFNDSGMILDCLSPAFPKPTRVMMYSCSSVLRSLCGVAAGSSKASLSAHFAKWGNLGELNAKDSSQETIISLLGMLAGSLVVSHIKTQFATWSAMIFLLAIHLGTNYLAVRAVSMRTLNRQRANIVFSHYLTATSPNRSQKQKQKAETPPEPRILNPNQVSLVERIFERDGVLRWNNSSVYGRCILGIDLQSILKEMSRQDPSSNSFTKAPVDPKRLIKSIHARGYFLWYAPDRNRYQITFSTTATVKTQLLAWFHALVAAHELHNEKAGVVDHEVDARMTDGATRGRFLIRHFLFVQSAAWTRRKTVDPVGELRVEDIWEFLDVMGQVAIERFEGLWRGLKENGWDLETGALETKSGTRVKVIGDGLEEKEKL